MAISSKTRKTLWGRSGNRCAICKSVLIDSEDENDVNLNLGEECHIISSKPNGPRHLPNYDKDYDGYQNLILLCRNHHREIDERILSYPVAKLIAIKKAHEEWHDSKLKEKKKQLPKIGVLFKIENGKVNVEPFDYAYQDIKMNLYGSNGFDKSIDYTMKLTVPSDKFGGAASVANNWLSKQSIPLLNISVPKEITFHLNLSGLISKPNVKIVKVTADGSDKGVIEQVTSGIADKAKAEANKIIGSARTEINAEKTSALKKN